MLQGRILLSLLWCWRDRLREMRIWWSLPSLIKHREVYPHEATLKKLLWDEVGFEIARPFRPKARWTASNYPPWNVKKQSVHICTIEWSSPRFPHTVRRWYLTSNFLRWDPSSSFNQPLRPHGNGHYRSWHHGWRAQQFTPVEQLVTAHATEQSPQGKGVQGEMAGVEDT